MLANSIAPATVVQAGHRCPAVKRECPAPRRNGGHRDDAHSCLTATTDTGSLPPDVPGRPSHGRRNWPHNWRVMGLPPSCIFAGGHRGKAPIHGKDGVASSILAGGSTPNQQLRRGTSPVCYASRADSCRLPEICQSDLHTVSRCGPRLGPGQPSPPGAQPPVRPTRPCGPCAGGDRFATPRRSSLGQRLGRLQTMLASRPASRASIGCRHRPGSAGATAGAASPGRLSTCQLGCRRDPRFCDSDLEADAIMLTILAVQRAVRELNRDACRPAVQSAAS
jgi:hypothetical protein